MQKLKRIFVFTLVLVFAVCVALSGCNVKGKVTEHVEEVNYSGDIETGKISVDCESTGELYLVYKFTEDNFPMTVPEPTNEEAIRQMQQAYNYWQEWHYNYTTDIAMEYNGVRFSSDITCDNTYRIQLFDACEKKDDGTFSYINLNKEGVETTISGETEIEVQFYFGEGMKWIDDEQYFYPATEKVSYKFKLYPTQEDVSFTGWDNITINYILGQTAGPVNDEATVHDEEKDLDYTWEEFTTAEELNPTLYFIHEKDATGTQYVLWAYYPVSYLRLSNTQYRVWYKWKRVQGNEIFKTDTIEFLPVTGVELKERGTLQPIVVTHKTGEGENDFVNAQLEFAVRLRSEEGTKITQFTDYSPAAFRAALNEYSVGDGVCVGIRFKGCDVEGYGVLPSVGISYWLDIE